MNKYVLRTSLVWLAVMAAAAAIYWKAAPGGFHRTTEHRSEPQPVAAGPADEPQPQPEAAEQAPPAPLSPLHLSPQLMQTIGVTIGKAEYRTLTSDIRAVGTIQIDQRLVSYVQVRFTGYLRNVFVNATYLNVHRGEPLFTIYSPALAATEQEYLLALRNQQALRSSTIAGVASGASSLAAAARERLEQWEVSTSEMQRLEQSHRPALNLTIDSPVSGYVTEMNAVPNMFVEPSTRLYTVADLSRVWVTAAVFEEDVGRLKPGDRVDVTTDAYPGRSFHGRIDRILPQVDPVTRTVGVRVVMENPGLRLKPGMYVNCDLKSPAPRRLTIPAAAVFQTGTRSLVFLYQDSGELQPKAVTLGAESAGYFPVLEGVKPGERIVTSANFLIDSETQLQAGAESSAPPPPGVGRTTQPTKSSSSGNISMVFTSIPNPPRKGTNRFRVTLASRNAPLNGANVVVTFSMAAMPSMGMPASKVTSNLNGRGHGIYEGAGSLPSGGDWRVTIVARENGQIVAEEHLQVSVSGGM